MLFILYTFLLLCCFSFPVLLSDSLFFVEIELPSSLLCIDNNMPLCSHHYQLFAHSAPKNSLLVSAVWLMILFLLSFFHGTFSASEPVLLSHVSSSPMLPLNCQSLVFHILFFSFAAACPSGSFAFRQHLYSVVWLTPESLFFNRTDTQNKLSHFIHLFL